MDTNEPVEDVKLKSIVIDQKTRQIEVSFTVDGDEDEILELINDPYRHHPTPVPSIINLLNPRTAIRYVTLFRKKPEEGKGPFDFDPFPSTVGNETDDLDPFPFIIRKEANDLDADERAQYRLRRTEYHNGEPYIAYYAKVLDASNVKYTSEGVQLVLDDVTVKNLIDAHAVTSHRTSVLMVSGFGLCSGVDKDIRLTDDSEVYCDAFDFFIEVTACMCPCPLSDSINGMEFVLQ